ncbi:hypothetical protein L211DRAFT_865665 [Terfezia boudieri ATCC MYA-4762]|uniref:Uncharacterized protein n=1 Tax=Terfezia boudieri ATCC MYA-4762 TaxID=1051890 RepID=A0A3N4LXA3_9PEZI|nr:hypothetical protein L211DRAFT_865665 [Terfezia boudieri ATCC MYA-4762]
MFLLCPIVLSLPFWRLPDRIWAYHGQKDCRTWRGGIRYIYLLVEWAWVEVWIHWGEVQIAGVHFDKKAKIVKVKLFNRTIEITEDSLSSGDFASYESASAPWAFLTGYGFENTEFSVTAYLGIYAADQNYYPSRQVPRTETADLRNEP